MAKDKIGKSITNKHLHARTTFLYQAATYLTLQASSDTAKADDTSEKASKRGHSGLALQLVSHLRTVSLKGQTRLSAKLKRSMCKACNSILVLGRTSTCSVENGSKDGKKPWADVMVVECNMCGSRKRYPVGAVRQNRKTYRALKKHSDPAMIDPVDAKQPSSPAVRSTTDQDPTSTQSTLNTIQGISTTSTC